ncbi:MAG: transporter [Bdellovibrionaceae bacterium]|nr:transporter [Pseudobdellovibrionaceae bacterium]|tara:strand:- start:621 stop:1502 length:882 start_codon:yes stop_codon:yes gene_type:complete
MKSETIKTVISWIENPYIEKFFYLTLTITVIVIITKIVKNVINQKISDHNLKYRTRKVLNFFSFLLILFTTSLIFNDKLGKLTVAFGIVGAGVAFALQELITSTAGWFAIIFNNYFKVGDRVQIAGIKGDVIDIGLFKTTLMEIGDWVNGDLYNGKTVRVSNSFIFKEPVFNYSSEFPFLWDEIQIPIHINSDIEFSKSKINEIAEEIVGHYEPKAQKNWKSMVDKFMIEDAKIEHFCAITADITCITVTLRYVTEYKLRRKVKDALFLRIIEESKKSNGKMIWAYSTLTVSH